jgi:hypothetical protein
MRMNANNTMRSGDKIGWRYSKLSFQPSRAALLILKEQLLDRCDPPLMKWLDEVCLLTNHQLLPILGPACWPFFQCIELLPILGPGCWPFSRQLRLARAVCR